MRPVLLALPVLLRLLPAAQGSAVPQLARSRPTHVLVAATATAAATSTSTAAAASASPVVASTRFAAAAAAAARRSLSPAALARPLSSRPALRTSWNSSRRREAAGRGGAVTATAGRGAAGRRRPRAASVARSCRPLGGAARRLAPRAGRAPPRRSAARLVARRANGGGVRGLQLSLWPEKRRTSGSLVAAKEPLRPRRHRWIRAA